jgi:hypothetical protein
MDQIESILMTFEVRNLAADAGWASRGRINHDKDIDRDCAEAWKQGIGQWDIR